MANFKYDGIMICFQEIPDETCLSFSITNCPHRCTGCHSPWLQTNCGQLVEEDWKPLMNKYGDYITCVLFMGGDDAAQVDELIRFAKLAKAQKLSTALYSGNDIFPSNPELLAAFDYIKVGSYQSDKGPLNSPTTNQRLYKKDAYNNWLDITYKFWRKPYEDCSNRGQTIGRSNSRCHTCQ